MSLSLFLRNLLSRSANRFARFTDGDGEVLAPRFPRYQIGKGSYGGLTVMDWGEGATLKIGAYCSISGNVKILLGGEHRTDWVTTYPFSARVAEARSIPGHPRTKGDVVIGNDVWIGYGAIILSGVQVGDGAVIGAGSVVSQDISPYAIFAGNPARWIRNRFPDETIRQLLQISWWNWGEEQIKAALPYLLSGQIEDFIQYAQRVFPALEPQNSAGR